jgi:hypothetical protein
MALLRKCVSICDKNTDLAAELDEAGSSSSKSKSKR